MRKHLVTTDALDQVDSGDIPRTLKLVGAVDISYSKTNPQKGIAYLAVFSYPEMKVVYED